MLNHPLTTNEETGVVGKNIGSGERPFASAPKSGGKQMKKALRLLTCLTVVVVAVGIVFRPIRKPPRSPPPGRKGKWSLYHHYDYT
jgi:hypothetical protein